MRVLLEQEQWTEARKILAELEASKDPVTFLQHRGLQARYEVQRQTGLNATTLRKIAEGKKPTKAQWAALKYAALERALNL